MNDAGTVTNPILGNLGKQTGAGFFASAIPAAISFALIVGALIFFAMLVWGAIEWISSGGDKQKLETARGRITSALVGVVLLFASFAIIKLIGFFFHIDVLNNLIFSLDQLIIR
jgi:hypothetical protein